MELDLFVKVWPLARPLRVESTYTMHGPCYTHIILISEKSTKPSLEIRLHVLPRGSQSGLLFCCYFGGGGASIAS